MELIKTNIHRKRQKEQVISQVTLDEDVIVPDTKADVESVIVDWADVDLEEVRLLGTRLMVRGRLYFRMLYHGQKSRMVDCVEGSLPFDETINVKEMGEDQEIRVDWEIEDLNISLIHSRKLNVKGLLTLTATAWEECSDLLTVSAGDNQGVEMTSRTLEVVQPAVQMRDTYRVKEEVELSSNKPNMDRVVWYRLEPRGIECRPLDGRLSIHGEMELFCIYKGEEEHIPLQWLERSIPFSGALDVPESTGEMIPEIRIRPVHRMVEAKEDYDGERRLLSVEAVLEMDVTLYREELVTVLDDVYCPGADVILHSRPVTVDHLVTRNASKYKMTEKINLGSADRILQICHADGAVKLDRIRPTGEGLDMEGTMCVDVLYVASDDQSPVRCVRGLLPFRYLAAAPLSQTSQENYVYRVVPGLEQLSAMLLGNGELEIKAMITLDSIVMEPMVVETIDNAQVVPMDPQKFEQMPGIVGYVVQKGDTLWKIAKKFYASVESIQRANHLTDDRLVPGQKLLIIKETRTF